MKRLLPVLHILSDDVDHTRHQVAVAVENGADGIWLINHSGTSVRMHEHFDNVRADHPDLWVGLNLLDMPAQTAMRIVTTTFTQGRRIDALWADDSGITDQGALPKAQETWEMKKDAGWAGEYFGSVAFKVGPLIRNAARAALAARGYMDVVTTSGPATGVAADVEKIKDMRAMLEGQRLAVASGITPENAEVYLPYVDDLLVATGISHDFHTLDPVKVRALADVVHG